MNSNNLEVKKSVIELLKILFSKKLISLNLNLNNNNNVNFLRENIRKLLILLCTKIREISFDGNFTENSLMLIKEIAIFSLDEICLENILIFDEEIVK